MTIENVIGKDLVEEFKEDTKKFVEKNSAIDYSSKTKMLETLTPSKWKKISSKFGGKFF